MFGPLLLNKQTTVIKNKHFQLYSQDYESGLSLRMTYLKFILDPFEISNQH